MDDGFAFGGLLIGNIAADIGGMMGQNAQFRAVLETMGGVRGLTDGFFAAVLGLLAVLASAYGVQAALRLRSEEAALLAEPLLSTAVRRTTWIASHLTIAFLGTAWLVLVMGAGAGLAHGAQTSDLANAFERVVGAALVQIPATWMLVGIVAVLFGLLPRWSPLAWVVLVFFLLLGEFGSLFELNQAVMDISPYAHVPKLPGGELTMTPLLGLTGVAALLTIVGVLGFRRRDLQTA